MKRPSYLAHHLSQLNPGDADHRARKLTPWLASLLFIVWTPSVWWMASQECEYRHQRERAMQPIPSVSTGLPDELSRVSEGYGARIVNETTQGLVLEF